MKKFFALLAITVGFATVSFAQTAEAAPKQEVKKECKSENGEAKACCKKSHSADASAKPACHGAEKTASAEGAAKKECSKGGEAKACCKKDGASATASAEGAAKKECSKDGEAKACCKKAGDAKTKE